MTVHIKDFSVETEGSSIDTPAQAAQMRAQPPRTEPQPRAQTAREVADLLRLAQERACRLHAD